MTPNEFVDNLEKSQPNRIPTTIPIGTGRAYFEKILVYYGTAPRKLQKIGKYWEKLVDKVDDPAWVWRAAGVVLRLSGEWRKSADCFLQAGFVGKSALERASFPVGAIDSLARLGDIIGAETLAKNLYKRLRKLGEHGLAARAMFNLGNALIYQDRMTEARKALLSALPGLVESGFALEAASAQMALSSTYLFDGDPRRALSLANLAMEGATELSADYLVDLAGLNVALAHLVMNDLEDARAKLVELQDRLNESPLDRSRIAEYLGDTYFKLNLVSDALASYQSALQDAKFPVHKAHLWMGIGECFETLENREEATAAYRRASQIFRKTGALGWLAVCDSKWRPVPRIQAKRLAYFAELEGWVRGSTYHHVLILLFQCEQGENRLVEAQRLIRKHGYQGLEWKVLFLKAKTSKDKGLALRRCFQAIQLGRLGFKSIAARSNYLRDKMPAIRSYFDWLLQNPTQARIAELREAIVQVRSVTLLDEVLSRQALPKHVVDLLNEARETLQFTVEDEIRDGIRRGLTSTSTEQFQRIATRALLELQVPTRSSASDSNQTLLLTETDGGLYGLDGHSAVGIELDWVQFSKHLKWMQYELLAPMADRTASSREANSILKNIGTQLLPILTKSQASICPDQLTWQVPWSLMSSAMGSSKEWAVCLHPSLTGRSPTPKGKPNLIWLGQSPDLNFAEREAELVQSRIGSCNVLKSAAEVRDSLAGNYGIVHVIGHAHHQNECPSLSSIDFPDGPIFAYEITRSALQVELATLSACDTGTVSLVTQNEPDGLARAFVSRGAAWVIANLWPLDDEAGLRLFDAFFKQFCHENDVLSALSHAKCITREWNEHPYFWGGLTAYAGLK